MWYLWENREEMSYWRKTTQVSPKELKWRGGGEFTLHSSVNEGMEWNRSLPKG